MTLVVGFLHGSNKGESPHFRKTDGGIAYSIPSNIAGVLCFVVVVVLLVSLSGKFFQDLEVNRKTPSAQI